MTWTSSLLAFILGATFAMAKGGSREPSQDTTFPGFPATPPAGTAPGAGAALLADDILAPNSARVQNVYCLFGGTSGYSISGASGNDVRISRVTAGGDIRYEVFKGTKFLGACPAVHVMSN